MHIIEYWIPNEMFSKQSVALALLCLVAIPLLAFYVNSFAAGILAIFIGGPLFLISLAIILSTMIDLVSKGFRFRIDDKEIEIIRVYSNNRMTIILKSFWMVFSPITYIFSRRPIAPNTILLADIESIHRNKNEPIFLLILKIVILIN